MDKLKKHIKTLVREMVTPLSTMEKILKSAVRDGYINSNQSSATYVMDAAKETADKFDKLSPEEKKVMRDTYYEIFLKKLGKKMNEESTSGDAGSYDTPSIFTKNTLKEDNIKILADKAKKALQTIKPTQQTYHTTELIEKPTEQWDEYDLSNAKSLLRKNNITDSLDEIVKDELLNEQTYNNFKNEVKYRTKNEMLHKSIREVKRKLNEVERLIEYAARVKGELSEGEAGIQYWKRSLKAINEINETSTRISNKLKDIYQ